MKAAFSFLLVALCTLVMLPRHLLAQEQAFPQFVTMQTNHFNLDLEDGSPEEWLALEKEFFDKVTSKNELIVAASVFTHFYSPDNSEVIGVAAYQTWEDIPQAQARNQELVEEGWPDADERSAFFEKRNRYYTGVHSDEIYRTMEGAKIPSEEAEPDSANVLYIQKRHIAMPEDGSNEERLAMMKEFTEAVTHQNDYIKRYYPLRHGWGSDNLEVLDLFVYESLADLEQSNGANGALIEAHWPDEEAREAFFDRYSQYFSGWHGDSIYSIVLELTK